MSRTIYFAVAAAIVSVAVILLPSGVWTAVAQDQMQPKGDIGQKAFQPSLGTMEEGANQIMPGDMEAMKMSEPTKMRCGMMMKMEVTSQDPAALMALKAHLKLTDEQVTRLKAIVAQARQDAAKVLTDEQKTKLKPLDTLPATMMEMHREMMGKMGQEKVGMKGQMMCPMMEQMSREQPEKKHSSDK